MQHALARQPAVFALNNNVTTPDDLDYHRAQRTLRGRPRELGNAPGVMIRFRMAPEYLRDADERAKEKGLNRSQYIRSLIEADLKAA